MQKIARIVSGGQAGTDRAALDAAIHAGVPYAGWCPAGGWAEDRPDPPGLLVDHPLLRPTVSDDPSVRTRLNVRDSDATLVVRGAGVRSPGTDLTVSLAAEIGRPCLVTPGSASQVSAWLAGLPDGVVLNVAGPRESEQPGCYASVLALLADVLSGPA